MSTEREYTTDAYWTNLKYRDLSQSLGWERIFFTVPYIISVITLKEASHNHMFIDSEKKNANSSTLIPRGIVVFRQRTENMESLKKSQREMDGEAQPTVNKGL